MIVYHCRHCGDAQTVDESLAGHVHSCALCGKSTVVPGEAPKTPAEAHRSPPMPRTRRRGWRGLPLWCVLALVGLLFVGLIYAGRVVGALILLVFLIAGAIVEAADAQAGLRGVARFAYEDALVRLRMAPKDPTLREHALQLGRTYSALTRDDRRVALFDEVAISNDLNAACAGPAQQVAMPVATNLSLEQRLERLESLKDRGLVVGEEYEQRRRGILDEL